MTMTLQEKRILGAFYGQALGDAMGMPSELWPRSRVKQHFGVTHHGEINAETIGANILHWAESFDAFNKNVLGPTSKIALNAMKAGTPVSQLENNGMTNGAAMRVSPLGCLLPARDLSTFIEAVALASSPTHKSDVAISGATVIAWAVSRAIDGASWATICDELPVVARAAQEKRETTFSASMAARLELALGVVKQGRGVESSMQQIYDLVGTGTSTIESVPAAIAMVELAETDPNRCAILCANLGGDTDTIGAMAVAICGALHGIDSIDTELKAELDAANALDFTRYSQAFLVFRQQREAAYADA